MEKPNKTLEKQITLMLNNVIGDEEQYEISDKLSLSEELENDDDNIFIIKYQENNIRNSKTHHQRNSINNENENLFNIQDFQIRNSKTLKNLNFYYNQNIQSKNYQSINLNSNNNSIHLLSNNKFFINKYNNSNYQINNLQSQIIYNSLLFNNNFINNQHYIHNDNCQKINPNSSLLNNNKSIIDNNLNCNNNNRNNERKRTYDIHINSLEKNKEIKENSKFGTSSYSNNTNLNLEILIYEMKKLLIKNDKIDYYIFNKLQGHITSIIKTNKGSRIFQNYLKNTQCDILHQILLEISPELSELIINPYANYFCGKFFTYLNQKDRIEFLAHIKKSLFSLCLNNIGTYPIQGIIEYLGSKIEKNIIINELKDKINELSFDPYGAHVLEKIISCFEEEYIDFIYKFISNNLLNLAYNANGICIIKKIISFTHKKNLHEQIKKTVIENSMEIIKHPYGNFIIQSIIENWDLNETKEIINLYKDSFIDLSMEKFASNVIERCIEKDSEILFKYINDLVNSKRIFEVMKDNFGNFVIQKALKLAFGYNKNILIEAIYNNIYKLNNKKLIIKWKSLLIPHLVNNDLYETNEKIRNE